MGKQMQQTNARALRKVFCLAIFCVVSAAVAVDFEKIALVDSFDFATFCDPETRTGNTAIIDHVLGTGATAVYWRNQSADWPRYPSREMDRRQMAHGLDKRRRANWNLVYGWLRLDRGRDVKNLMADAFSQLRARGVNTGIHLTFEETHCRIAWTFSPWNLDHPQYWVRLRDDIPYAGRCSFFYDEVLAHKMRLVDELLEMDGDTILLDFYRAGWWTPAYEYVPGMCAEFRKTYGEEPPKDAKDPRWLKLVGKYMERYLRAIRARIDASPRKKRFMVCLSVCSGGLPRPAPEMLPDGAAYDRLCLENLALDWKKLAADGVFDAVAVASAVIAENERDPWGKIAMVYDHVRANCGKAALYGHCSMYDYQQCGIARCAKAAGISQAEAARKLLEVARACGAKGVLMECVDPGNYPPDVMEAIRSFK